LLLCVGPDREGQVRAASDLLVGPSQPQEAEAGSGVNRLPPVRVGGARRRRSSGATLPRSAEESPRRNPDTIEQLLPSRIEQLLLFGIRRLPNPSSRRNRHENAPVAQGIERLRPKEGVGSSNLSGGDPTGDEGRANGEEQIPVVKGRSPMIRQTQVVHSDPEIMGGTPVFVGTRVPLRNLVDYLEHGHSLDEFLDSFPSVSREQAVAALKMAHDLLAARASAA
jgi:uncharacterized protein (DUF433 family)